MSGTDATANTNAHDHAHANANANANDELRSFLRVATAIHAEISAAGGTVSGLTRDVSIKGVFILTDQLLPEGSTCSVLLRLDGQRSGGGVRATGYVSRAVAEGIAIEFTAVIGLDSWDHLRGLVMLNAEDVGRAQSQLAGHVGLRPRPETL